MLNHIDIMGRITKDPELRTTGGGTPVCSFSVAVDRDMKNHDGSRTTDFIDVVAWRGAAEFVSRYFKKGSAICVSGRLQIREWTDKENHKRRNAEVFAENVYFAERKTENTSFGSQMQESEPVHPSFEDLGQDDGELPF